MSAGLRTFVPIATLMMAIVLDAISVTGTWFEFLDSPFFLVPAIVFSIGEMIGDKLPIAPNRTEWLGLGARVFSGAFSGVVLMACVAGNSYPSVGTGAVLGITGALVGTFGGFYLRTRLVKRLAIRGLYVAICEDATAIGLAAAAIFLIS